MAILPLIYTWEKSKKSSVNNTYTTGKVVTCEEFSCTRKSGTWNPCLGLGTPNFLALYKILKNSLY